MLIEQLQQLSELFARRFFFNALLPSLIFGSLSFAAVLFTVTDLSDLSAWWQNLDVLTKAITVLAYLTFVWFVASAVASQWRGIVRLYEGYFLRRALDRRARPAVGVRWHQQRLEAVWGANQADGYYRYPPPDHRDTVLPTRLGNILLASETYPYDRYNADAVIFWPRLYPLLPEQFQRDYEQAVADYQFPLVISFLSAVTVLIADVALLINRQSPVVFLAVTTIGVTISYVAYVLALTPAIELGERLRTAFDLYRDRLLEAWPTVADIHDEKVAFKEITFFVLANAPPSARWEATQSAHQSRRRIATSDTVEPSS